ncbi:FecR family protein [Chitinophaga varians]|uniref:FecR family protein n=1 Tax=Chitinophaga varians TaxID=2202339 RepID=A0A847RI28_9BACT|nr:FecR family protein [Chitinophaga varians]NLR62753.1 FecR family protein [Chitinophaga varians]
MGVPDSQQPTTFLQRVAYLISRHQQDQLTASEAEELRAWLDATPENRRFMEQWNDTQWLASKLQSYSQPDVNTAWEAFRAKHLTDANFERAPRKTFRLTWRHWSAAAAVVLLAGTAWYVQRSRPAAPVAQQQQQQTPVLPGTSKAVLTLADGSTIQLDSAGRQVIAQGAASIHQQNGQLRYDIQNPDAAPALNTLTTPRGGQFRVILPDGTAVWLNAASSITYPTAFREGNRQVSITGEAYLEVTSKANHPFQVKINDHTTVDVLGTSFCISAYANENTIRTTLVSGAVKVNTGNTSRTLAPGQQAQITNGNIVVSPTDTAAAIAWKNGEFYFNNADIPAIMRQLERWYDVHAVYEGSIPVRTFQGEIQRNLPLEDILEGLQSTGIRFHMKGRNIIVQP